MVVTRSQARKEAEAKVEQATPSIEALTNDTPLSEASKEAETKVKAKTPTIESLVDDVLALSLVQAGEAPPEEEEVFEDVMVTTVEDFGALMERVPAEQWKKRMAALDSLVTTITTNDDWNTQEQLEDMAPALAVLLKDPRSLVVKRTCAALSQLFNHCQKSPSATNLWFAILPTILDCHGLTSTVIRSQVQAMAEQSLKIVPPHRDALPLLLHRLDTKSKTVREACVLYLSLAMEHHWSHLASTTDEALLQEITLHLIAALRDPSPQVRQSARKGAQVVRQAHPSLWESLVRQPSQPRDAKLQKFLLKSLQEPTLSLEQLVQKQQQQQSTKSKKPSGSRPAFSKFLAFQKQQMQKNEAAKVTNSDVLVVGV